METSDAISGQSSILQDEKAKSGWLTALRVAAIKAGKAVVETDYGAGLTFFAQLCRAGEFIISRIPWLIVKLAALGIQKFLLVLIGPALLEHTDCDHVLLDDIADFGHDRRRIAPPFLEISALRVEHAAQLIDQESDVTTLAKHRCRCACRA